MSASNSSAEYGQSVTFTATVRSLVPGAGVPTGEVWFGISLETNPIYGYGLLSPAPDGSATASFTTPNLANQVTEGPHPYYVLSPGVNRVWASYGGDSTFGASGAGPESLVATYAGTGVPGYSGDGGPAVAAQLSGPRGLAVDSAGNLYIADTASSTVRMVRPDGTITTYAGAGMAGYGGDGGPATAALLKGPTGLAVDDAGNLYIADSGNARVRKVDPYGTITTYAGNGLYPSSDLDDAGDGGAATAAMLSYPVSLAVDDAGNVFIGDLGGGAHRVRKVDPYGTITTYAGTGAPPSSSDAGDGGPATSVGIWEPTGLAIDGSGDLLILDRDHLLKVRSHDGTFTTVVRRATGVLPSTSYGLAVASRGDVFISDAYGGRVLMLRPDGTFTTVAGAINPNSGFPQFINGEPVQYPTGLAVDGLGTLYIVETNASRVRFLAGTQPVFVSLTHQSLQAALDASSANGGSVTFQYAEPAVADSVIAAVNGLSAQPNPVTVELNLASGGFRDIAASPPPGVTLVIRGNGPLTTVVGHSPALVVSSGNVVVQGVTLTTETDSPTLLVTGGHLTLRDSTVEESGGGSQAAITIAGGSADLGTMTAPGGNVLKVRGAGLLIDNATTTNVTALGDTFQADGLPLGSLDSTRSLTRGLVQLVPTTTTTLTATVASPLEGQVETFIATVVSTLPTDDAPTGTVTFYDGLQVLGTRSLSTTGGITTATLTTSALAAGSRSIFAVYGGDSTFHGSDTRTVSLYAGGGTTSSFRGDGGPATRAAFLNPNNVAVDRRDGTIYISDFDENTVRRIGPDGTITTVAGSGSAGYSGDGGPAGTAQLNGPYGLAVDAQGNLFIAEWFNNVVRQVRTDGTIVTFAGDGAGGYDGDGGLATSAQLSGPDAVVLDEAGNLFIADAGNGAIRRRIDRISGVITTVAGNGSRGYSGDGGPATEAQLSDVFGMTFDADGNLYIADYGNCVVRRVDTSGIITTVAGDGTPGYAGDGGPAIEAQFGAPAAVAIDTAGNLLIADASNNAIRRVDHATGIITTMAGDGTAGYYGDGGPAGAALLASPNDLVFDGAGNLLIVDTFNDVLRSIRPDGSITTVAGTGSWGGVGAAIEVMLNEPHGLAVDAAGNLFIADGGLVRKVGIDGTIATVVGDPTGGYVFDHGSAIRANLDSSPRDIAVGPSGELLIRTRGGSSYYVAPDGMLDRSIVSTSFDFPRIAFDPQGNLVYSVPLNAGRVFSLSSPPLNGSAEILVAGNGQSVSSGDGGPATLSGLVRPSGVAYDSEGNLFILTADGVRKVGLDGIISTVYGFLGQAPSLHSRIAVDPQGDLYVLDPTRNQLVEVRPDGTITALMGNGTEIPIPASFTNSATAFAVDGSGNLFYIDTTFYDIGTIPPLVKRLGGLSLIVSPVTETNLQSVLDDPSQAGSVTIQPTSSEAVSAIVEAINSLSPPSEGTNNTVTLLLASGATYASQMLNLPDGVQLVVTTDSPTTLDHWTVNAGIVAIEGNVNPVGWTVNGGTVTLNGVILSPGSPALTVTGGHVILGGAVAYGSDAPTILVTGGVLTVRNSTIQESHTSDQAAIQITGGIVDLGTEADPGGNVINIIGTGEWVQNASGHAVSAVGTMFTIDGASAPSSLSGLVFSDFNNDGEVDFGEQGIQGATLTLDGTDFLGNLVHLEQLSDTDGAYVFRNLYPGHYTITETQPDGYTQGTNRVGTGQGTIRLDQFDLYLAAGLDALNYNYGERPAATGVVGQGQTAGIGFWNNRNGQNLIKALNGGGTQGSGTQLGNWLAATFSNMFGADAGDNNLAGKTNAQVASYFQSRFVLKDQKLDAQVLATALAVYVTNATLNPTGVGTQYGFVVGGNGVGTATFNVGSNGAAFGVADGTVMTVMDLLLAADAQAVNGVLYSGNTTRRSKATNVFGAINQIGGI